MSCLDVDPNVRHAKLRRVDLSVGFDRGIGGFNLSDQSPQLEELGTFPSWSDAYSKGFWRV